MLFLGEGQLDTLSVSSHQSAVSRDMSTTSHGNQSLTSQTTLEDSWRPQGSLPSYTQVVNSQVHR